MFDLSKLNISYHVRPMKDSDADAILEICLQNEQYYRYCGKQPSRELILNDLHITPPNTSADAKYYVGFYDKTDRLKIYPAMREQMEAIIAAEQDEERKKAYNKMLDGCLQHPDQREWYAIWIIEKIDGTRVGDFCFKGLQKDSVAEKGDAYGTRTDSKRNIIPDRSPAG